MIGGVGRPGPGITPCTLISKKIEAASCAKRVCQFRAAQEAHCTVYCLPTLKRLWVMAARKAQVSKLQHHAFGTNQFAHCRVFLKSDKERSSLVRLLGKGSVHVVDIRCTADASGVRATAGNSERQYVGEPMSCEVAGSSTRGDE